MQSGILTRNLTHINGPDPIFARRSSNTTIKRYFDYKNSHELLRISLNDNRR